MCNTLAVLLTIVLSGVGGLLAADLTTTLVAAPPLPSVVAVAPDLEVAPVVTVLSNTDTALLTRGSRDALDELIGPTIEPRRDADHHRTGVEMPADHIVVLIRHGALIPDSGTLLIRPTAVSPWPDAAGFDPATRISLPWESQLISSSESSLPPVTLDSTTAPSLLRAGSSELFALPSARTLTRTNSGHTPASVVLLATSLNGEPAGAQREAVAR